jgi:hypothetical protein
MHSKKISKDFRTLVALHLGVRPYLPLRNLALILLTFLRGRQTGEPVEKQNMVEVVHIFTADLELNVLVWIERYNRCMGVAGAFIDVVEVEQNILIVGFELDWLLDFVFELLMKSIIGLGEFLRVTGTVKGALLPRHHSLRSLGQSLWILFSMALQI